MTTSVSDGLRHATQKARDDKENGESCEGRRNAWREELFHGGIAEPCSESSTQPCEARPLREGIPPRDFRGRWREFGAHNSGYCGAACKWAEEEEEEGEACGREIWMALARLFHRGSIIEKKLCNNMVGSKGNFLRSEHLYLLFTFPL